MGNFNFSAICVTLATPSDRLTAHLLPGSESSGFKFGLRDDHFLFCNGGEYFKIPKGMFTAV
jgi:hypothetical protein